MYKNNNRNSTSAGFTLIELLVVIAIIGLLASVVLVALNAARVKARDAKRIADFRQIQTALELYYNENNNTYPTCSGSIYCSSDGSYTDIGTLLTGSYINKVPKDPINMQFQYGYYYSLGYKPAGTCGWQGTGLNNNYILATRLENPASSPNACTTGVFTGWQNNFLNYIVGSAQ